MILRHDDPMAWDGAPSEEELHAEFLAWIWAAARPEERVAIQHERIRAARLRGDPRCPGCGEHHRSTCSVCVGAGFAEPALRPTTPTEERVARRAAASAPSE